MSRAKLNEAHLHKADIMSPKDIFSDKILKPKEKTTLLSERMLEGVVSMDHVVEFARASKDPIKASCIEALEFVSKTKPEIISESGYLLALENLNAKAPRLRWESGRLIGNTAAFFPKQLEKSINALLVNTEHEGTVVRWSAAYALGEIYLQKTKFNRELLPAFESIIQREEKNSIKKIYQSAIKKVSNGK